MFSEHQLDDENDLKIMDVKEGPPVMSRQGGFIFVLFTTFQCLLLFSLFARIVLNIFKYIE